jgi:hypothetical protein
MAAHGSLGTPFDAHVAPESVEEYIPPPPIAAKIIVPSAEEAIAEYPPKIGALFDIQEIPEFVDSQIPVFTANNLFPSGDEATAVQ